MSAVETIKTYTIAHLNELNNSKISLPKKNINLNYLNFFLYCKKLNLINTKSKKVKY